VLNGKFVIDAVTHGFDNRPENCIGGGYAERIVDNNYDFQRTMMPERYRLTHEQYYQRMTPDMVAYSLFAESDTDVAVYHPLPTWGVFKDFSPVDIGLEIGERWPGRMTVYGAVSPLEGSKVLDELERQVSEWNVTGVKLYPVDLIDGRMRSFSMGDEKIAYPVFQKCLDLGIRVVAIHKALPLGTAPVEVFRPDDVDYAARDFPDLHFEIVHGGFAFLDETASQVGRFDNVCINLEATAQLLCRQPELFARILGTLLFSGGAKKIFWGTGAAGAGHPAPVLDAFEQFRMPASLVEGYGFPEVTDDMKADILANNFARVHGWSIEKLAREIADDEFARLRADGGLPPWSHAPEPVGAA
jgi:hypothetical protein